jgi:hypothetical protein
MSGFDKCLFLPASEEERKADMPRVYDKLSSSCSSELASKVANNVAKNRVVAFVLAGKYRDIFSVDCFKCVELNHI